MTHFAPPLFQFLKELKLHNDRAWFAANKPRYERDVRDPLLRFVTDFAEPLAALSPAIVADARPTGGSLFRIYRDTRFSKDKTPYKTHAAVQFRHRAGKDVHAPGFYLHLEPGAGRVFGGAGIWRPDPPTLAAIRAAIVKDAAGWTRVMSDRRFRTLGALSGEKTARPPRGFDPEHPLIEDLKRKDFVAIATWSQKQAMSADFMRRFVAFCAATEPLMAFLAKALKLDW